MLPSADHVVRTCKAASVDQSTMRPTPAAFEFRLKDGAWNEGYLSVNWLEYLHPQPGDFATKLAKLRAFLSTNEHGLPVLKPSAKSALAVLPIATIQPGRLEDVGTVLECRHEPHGEGDPHAGIYPNPGVEHWPVNVDEPAHLAVQQFLFQSMCHWEPGVLASAAA